MATDREFIDYVLEQADLGSRLTVKSMFGEYGLYVDGKITAFAGDNSLYLKASDAKLPVALADLPQRPMYPGSKDYAVMDELLDDGDTLRSMLLLTAKALPEPKPKAKPNPKPKATRAKSTPKPKAKPKS